MKFKDTKWVVRGDFNSPLNVGDKLGGKDDWSKSKKDLREFVNQNKLIDLHLNVNAYTWTNSREDNEHILIRLDIP